MPTEPPARPEPSEEDVTAFLEAVHVFREASGNRFPTAGRILEIARTLGWAKGTDARLDPASLPAVGGDESPIMDRRLEGERRSGRDRRHERQPAGANRRGGADRRQRDRRKAGAAPPQRNINSYVMDEDVREFVGGIAAFRERHERFPTGKELLSVLIALGYRRPS